MSATDFATVLGGAGNVSKTALITLFEQRGIYVIEDGETPTALTPGNATHLAYRGLVFWYDSTDATTAHDGISCIVTADGKRFKSDGFDGAQARFWHVKDKDLSAPPGSPTISDSYIVAAAGSGAWAAKDKYVATWTARGWQFQVPTAYDLAAVIDETTIYHYSAGGSWTSGFPFITVGDETILPSALKYGRFGLSVVNQTTDAPPGSPGDGDAYVIDGSPTGAWTGHAREIAIYQSSAWVLYTPYDGATVYDTDTATTIVYNAGAWVPQSSGYAVVTSVYTAAAVAMASGALSAATDYDYSATTAPTATIPHSTDPVSLSYAAKKAGAILEITYRCCKDSGAGTFIGGIIPAVQVDSTNAMDDWVNLGGTAFPTFMACTFLVTAPDTSSHTYKINFFYTVTGATTPTPVVGRRLLTIKERS